MSLSKMLLKSALALSLGVGMAAPTQAQGFFGTRVGAAQIEAARARFPALKLELIFPKKQYALGEAIDVVMRYSNSEQAPFKVELINYDRSGRIMAFGFSALDADGKTVRDPYSNRGGIMGGIRGERSLVAGQPFEQTATVNEWLAFDQPGTYQLSAQSGIVSAPADEKNPYGQFVPLQSAPVEIEIVAPDEQERVARLERVATVLQSGDVAVKRTEARELRWMLDERAIPLLIPLLESKDVSIGFQAQRGLAAFVDQKPVVAALLRRLDEPDPISDGVWNVNSLLPVKIPWGADAPPGTAATLEVEKSVRLQAKVRAAMRRAESAQNPREAANFAADLLGSSANYRDAALWHRFWKNATLAMPEKQNSVAFHLNWEATELKGGKKPFATEVADLQRAVKDASLQSELRSAAALALARRGDRSFLPLLAADALAVKPKLSGEALALLGEYQARPRALKLLQVLRARDAEINFDRRAIAARIRDLGSGATVPELVAAARELIKNQPYSAFPLLEAVALQSPDAALPLLKAYSGRLGVSGVSDESARLLIRLQTPAARDLALDWLNKRNKSGQPSAAMVYELRNAGYEIASNQPVGNVGYAGERHLKAGASWTAAFVPALLQLWDATPNFRERAEVESALSAITRLPRQGMQNPTPENQAKWRAMWAAWKPDSSPPTSSPR